VRCVVEQVAAEPDPMAQVAMPWIWGAPTEEEVEGTDTVEACEVDYSQKVRAQAEPEPQMLDYAVSLPVD
jgi:hypothetical protein